MFHFVLSRHFWEKVPYFEGLFTEIESESDGQGRKPMSRRRCAVFPGVPYQSLCYFSLSVFLLLFFNVLVLVQFCKN